MAATQPQPLGFDLSTPETHALPVYRRLALLNGLLIGLALGLGAWGLETLQIIRLPFQLYAPTLVLGIVLVTAICGLTGWLTGRLARTWLTFLLWLLTAVAVVLIMGYLSFYGRTLVVWLADRRFWGQVVYPNTLGGSNSGLILGGFLIIFALGFLGILQGYRLENIVSHLGGANRLNGRAWLSLLLPLPLVFLAAYLTKDSMSDPAAASAMATYGAIETARQYEGDLYQLGLEEGVNYGALSAVRDQLSGVYTLNIAEVDPAMSTVFVSALFDDGAWIVCRVINEQLSHCYDPSKPYTVGLQSLITGEAIPESCRGCAPDVAGDWAGWLAARRDRLGVAPQIERVAQQGTHVLMRVTSTSGDYAVECWFRGVSPATLIGCRETS